MTPVRPLLAALALVAATACSAEPAPASAPSGTPSSSPSPDATAAGSTYVALGDSVAAGVGAEDPATGGYVPLLAARLRDRLGCDAGQAAGCPLAVRNLAVSGATTATVLRAQVPEAVRLLQADDGVRLVTVTAGGNDVFGPVLLACLGDPAAPACPTAVADALAAADRGLDAVLGALRAAAGDRTTLAVMTYYDPVPTCRLASLAPLAAQVLEGGDGRPGLGDVVRARAAEHGAVVVETAERVSGPEDLVGGGDCLHPSGQGHAALAAAFDDAVGGRVASARQDSGA